MKKHFVVLKEPMIGILLEGIRKNCPGWLVPEPGEQNAVAFARAKLPDGTMSYAVGQCYGGKIMIHLLDGHTEQEALDLLHKISGGYVNVRINQVGNPSSN